MSHKTNDQILDQLLDYSLDAIEANNKLMKQYQIAVDLLNQNLANWKQLNDQLEAVNQQLGQIIGKQEWEEPKPDKPFEEIWR